MASTHSVMVHERNFVGPDDPEVHIQKVEGLWMWAKRKLRRMQCGTNRLLFTWYLDEFAFRNANPDRHLLFGNFLARIRDSYARNHLS